MWRRYYDKWKRQWETATHEKKRDGNTRNKAKKKPTSDFIIPFQKIIMQTREQPTFWHDLQNVGYNVAWFFAQAPSIVYTYICITLNTLLGSAEVFRSASACVSEKYIEFWLFNWNCSQCVKFARANDLIQPQMLNSNGNTWNRIHRDRQRKVKLEEF